MCVFTRCIYPAAALCLAALLASCADMFQAKVPMGSGSDGTLGSILLPETEITQLSPPQELFVSQYDSAQSIRITWAPSALATSYLLERAVCEPVYDQDGNASYSDDESQLQFETVQEYVYGTSYTDKILQNPQTDSPEYTYRYYYRVTACTRENGIDDSEPVLSSYGALLAPPRGAAASTGTSTAQITVQWQPATGALTYRVYRSETENASSAVYIANVYGNRTEYTDKIPEAQQGVEFYYYIYAVSASNSQSIAGNAAMGFAKVEGAPDAPENVRVPDGRAGKKITVEWDPVDADDVSYIVYRASSQDTTMTRLTSTDGIPEHTYIDTTAKTGLYYYYQIQAQAPDPDPKNDRMLKSALSDSGASSQNPAEGFLLSPPAESGVVKQDGRVTVKWLPAIGNEMEQKSYTYRIYGGDDMNAVNMLCKEIPGSAGTDSQGYLSASVDAYTYYKITTVNSSSEESPAGEIMSPSPAAAELTDVSKAAPVGGAPNDLGVYGVQITWKKPADDEPYGYAVYRATSPGGSYRRINEDIVMAENGKDTYEYIDYNDSAKVGKYYYYKVLALNMLEQGINYSEEKYGYGALTHEQYLIEFNKTIVSSQKKMDYINRPGSTDKLGSETVSGDISGSVYYNAKVSGLGARIIIQYTNYADSYIDGDSSKGPYFVLNGNSNTSAEMTQNGTMDGTITCTGMYPGSVNYDRIQIKGGAAGGGTYGVTPQGFGTQQINWTILN